MKKLITGIFLLGAFNLFAQDALDLFSNHMSWDFAPGDIPGNDINRIVGAGLNAPSANNRQPWYITVVQTPSIAKQIIQDTIEGNILIIVSARGDSNSIYRQSLDCGLAIENIYLAARILGYGSHIYTSPIGSVNVNMRQQLGLPDDYRAVALIRVGRIRVPPDVISGASQRKNPSSLVDYK